MTAGYKTVFILGSLLLLLILGFYALLYFQQRRLIFIPDRTPLKLEYKFASSWEERWVEINNTKIHSLYFKADSPKGVILYFHGNAGSLESWGYAAEELMQKTSWDVWIMDYPGYGKSEGEILSEAQLHEMAETFFNQLPDPKLKTVLYGRSIGSGIAVKLGSKKAIAGLILETPYTSLRKLALEKMSFIPGFLVQFSFQSEDWLPEVKSPILIVHGTQDELIPLAHGKTLSEKALTKTTFAEIPQANHNNISEFREYWTALEKFLNEI